MKIRPGPLVAALALGALVLPACGQYDGLHRPETLDERPVRFTEGAPAGERLTFDGTDQVAGAPPADPAAGGPKGEGSPAPSIEERAGGADGPLLACPVRGRGYYVANFGAYRPGPPVHPHQGNDMFAAYGTPIVAPFDGRAVATPNTLGGKAVKVYGPDGYVYNAHLSRYGRLGEVEMGEVVGFVGTTGNAAESAPHDHFEWHPRNGRAVDPFPFLNEACPAAA